jgi:predicted RNase H-related nuclease YkuK (DUF458 family)
MWTTLYGDRIEDITVTVSELSARGDRIIHVGTDSRNRGFHTHFVTVVAAISPGHGGRIFYRRTRHPRMRSLAQRLFHEAELSLEIAVKLSEARIPDVTVHVDANEDVHHQSSRYVAALAGMVVGYGFRVQVKPHAWCATHVADYVVKEKHKKAA